MIKAGMFNRLVWGVMLLGVVGASGGCGSSGGGDPCAANPAACKCASDASCSGANPRCDERTGQCVPCLPSNDNCPAMQRCVSTGPSYRCVPRNSCVGNSDCTSAGGGPGICCAGLCADPASDNTHCGTCGNTCGAVPNGMGACIAGSCGVASCNAGFGDCDAKPGNGCEVDLTLSLSHCGACGSPCKAAPNTTASCVSGKCESACVAEFADCDGNAANGCETSTTTNIMNCGACGKICPMLPNTTSVACVASACVVGSCVAGFVDCNKQPGDGCEAKVSEDPSNCGGCGRKCAAAPNAAPGCSGGNCTVGKCNPGFDDCDKNVLNGCEQDLLSDAKNCGGCGVVCTFQNGAGFCQGGKCTLQACNQGWADCDANALNGCETNVLTDVKNCGACANACPVPAKATASCSQGVCGIGSCIYGWADCNKNLGDGCETNVLTTQNCGACGNACPALQNASVSCPQAACIIGQCNAGFGDCDMKVFNGCEAGFASDKSNCGGCGIVCTFPNGVAACVASRCTLDSCAAGYADCNKNPVDGCEQGTNSDPKNCGACGVVCPQNAKYCVKGVCSPNIPGTLLGTINGQEFYKVQVVGTMSDNNIITACQQAGLRVPCQGPNGCQYNGGGAMCVATQELSCGNPMLTLSQTICGGVSPPQCAQLNNCWQFMGNAWQNGSSCGALNGTWCAIGNNFKDGFAICVP